MHLPLQGSDPTNLNAQFKDLPQTKRVTAAAAGLCNLEENGQMQQSIGYVSVVVRDYDEALTFFVGILGFDLVEDTYIPTQNKRWILLAPKGARETRLLLTKASTDDQYSRIGNQTGGRVFLFLHTDDFWRDYDCMRDKGVVFREPPREEPYGTVAVFEDLYGNLWDLLQLRS